MPAAIQCPTCQKEYPWKPELAGKRVKCKCGVIIEVPADTPRAEIDELYDLADAPEPKAQHGITDLQSAATAAAVAVDRSRQFPCPYCGEQLEPGSTMCVFCGSSLEGAIPKAPVTPLTSAMQSAPPVAKPVAMRREAEADRVGKTRVILMGVTALIVVAGAVLLIKRYLPSAPAKTDNLRPADTAIVEKIDNGQGAEVRDWLKADETRTLYGMNRKQALSKVDQWYDLGAKRVFVFNSGLSVALELPSEFTKRKAIFDWQKKWNTDNNFKLSDDIGQKWLEIQMHL